MQHLYQKYLSKSTFNGFIIADNPKTIVKFATFEPIIFPIAKSELFLKLILLRL